MTWGRAQSDGAADGAPSESLHFLALLLSSTALRSGAQRLAPLAVRLGSYRSQPALQKHGDTYLSDECLLFITWSGKMD